MNFFLEFSYVCKYGPALVRDLCGYLGSMGQKIKQDTQEETPEKKGLWARVVYPIVSTLKSAAYLLEMYYLGLADVLAKKLSEETISKEKADGSKSTIRVIIEYIGTITKYGGPLASTLSKATMFFVRLVKKETYELDGLSLENAFGDAKKNQGIIWNDPVRPTFKTRFRSFKNSKFIRPFLSPRSHAAALASNFMVIGGACYTFTYAFVTSNPSKFIFGSLKMFAHGGLVSQLVGRVNYTIPYSYSPHTIYTKDRTKTAVRLWRQLPKNPFKVFGLFDQYIQRHPLKTIQFYSFIALGLSGVYVLATGIMGFFNAKDAVDVYNAKANMCLGGLGATANFILAATDSSNYSGTGCKHQKEGRRILSNIFVKNKGKICIKLPGIQGKPAVRFTGLKPQKQEHQKVAVYKLELLNSNPETLKLLRDNITKDSAFENVVLDTREEDDALYLTVYNDAPLEKLLQYYSGLTNRNAMVADPVVGKFLDTQDQIEDKYRTVNLRRDFDRAVLTITPEPESSLFSKAEKLSQDVMESCLTDLETSLPDIFQNTANVTKLENSVVIKFYVANDNSFITNYVESSMTGKSLPMTYQIAA